MHKKIIIAKGENGYWYINLQNSAVMGDILWGYNTWQECLMHADVLMRVWDHI